MPSGVRIDGSRVTEEADVVIDDSFEDVPLAQLVGIPLKVKRCLVLPSLDEVDGRGGTNDSFGFRSMAKMMADPSTGFPPEPWNKAVGVQAATCQGPWPVLLAVRSDSLPFSPAEWEVLDDWLTTTTTIADAAVRRGKEVAHLYTPDAFRQHLLKAMSGALSNMRSPLSFMDIVCELQVRFPKGAKVKANSLSKEEVNGCVGTVTGTWDEEKQRVGVDFGQPHGLLSVKAVNLGPEETYEEFTRKKMAEYGLGSS
eukprot:TRINITY_DN10962_c0_g1_i1.p1 TRINITY_DN10962_c0_g1~~TRINITY_DN10962_c0_g1_i1.p1  ORF type:complete len:255 (+),score=37.49 TRINITY_DN10962_c0_g1_i1:62-826(+)